MNGNTFTTSIGLYKIYEAVLEFVSDHPTWSSI